MMTWCIANARALWGQFRLGVQQPALYWHFRNKRALLDALASLSIARDARRALRTADKQRIKIDNCD